MVHARTRGCTMDKETAIDRLAEHLHFTMERFDPSDDGVWSALPPYRQEFYRACVRELTIRRDLLAVVLDLDGQQLLYKEGRQG